PPDGGVFLDITHRKPDYIKRKLPSMYEQFLKLAKVDITKDPMEVAPTIHYAMGGVRVDPETGASTVPGLYAAGEVAAGLHGANRLGGNSLSDLLVFGKRAGEGAADAARANAKALKTSPDAREIDDAIAALMAPLERVTGENPYQLHVENQETMSKHAPIVRDGAGLEAGLQRILDATLSQLENPLWGRPGGWPTEDSPAARALRRVRDRRIAVARLQPRLAHGKRPPFDARQCGSSAPFSTGKKGEPRCACPFRLLQDRRAAGRCQLHRREIAGWDAGQATAADAAARPPCPGTPSVLCQIYA